jgi:anti-anti-sigma regulatory factor
MITGTSNGIKAPLTVGVQTMRSPRGCNQVSRGDRKLIFDLSGVQRVDSVGGVMLLRCFFTARETGGGLRVAGATENVTRLFKRTQIDAVIRFYPDIAVACEDFTTG